jgi:CDP-glucose 4,6-dehydratase
MFEWKNRKVLVTGATGFIGSWLTESLVKKGADVTILFKKDDPIGLESIKHIEKKIKIKTGDVRDKNIVNKTLKDQEILFHLAAVTQVIYSIKNPTITAEVNIGGTLNILDGIRNSNEDQFLVFISTDKVYGEPKYTPIDEEHPLIGKSPYDATKIAADRLVYAFQLTYNLKSSIIRPSNVFGGRDSNILRAVPDFITSIINGKSPVIRTHGEHKRDYMYITDVVNGFLLVAEKMNISNGKCFNFGTGRPTTVNELAELIIKMSGNEKKIKSVVLGKPSPSEIDIQFLSYKKAENLLGWKPTVDLETGLQKTIEWYRKNIWWQDVMQKVLNYYNLYPSHKFSGFV